MDSGYYDEMLAELHRFRDDCRAQGWELVPYGWIAPDGRALLLVVHPDYAACWQTGAPVDPAVAVMGIEYHGDVVAGLRVLRAKLGMDRAGEA